MNSFLIKFDFEGTEYSATVARIPRVGNQSTQYHVYDIEPKINGIPENLDAY